MRKIIIDKDVKIEGLTNRFPLDSLIAEIENGMVSIRDKETNEKELFEDFQSLVDGNGFLFGNNLQDTVDVLNIEFQQSNIIELVVGANQIVETEIKMTEFASAFIEVNEPGEKINPTGVVDNTNTSTGEANLINGNFTDLVYNNLSAGTVNKELPGIDLGDEKTIREIVLHWWNNTYTASNYKIQGSNDGNNWVDVVTSLNSTGIVGTENNPQKLQVNVNFRYIRPFCVQGNNASWCVVSELEVFDVGGVVVKELNFVNDVELLEQNGFIALKNSSQNDVNIKIIKR